MKNKPYSLIRLAVSLAYNKRNLALLVSLALLVMTGSRFMHAQTGTPPTITVDSQATFQKGANPIKVSPALALTGAENIDSATVVINNSVPDEDRLGVNGEANGTRDNIAWTYDQATGVLKLTGSAPVSTYQTILRDVTYANVSQTPTTTARTISFSIGSNLFFDENGHYYEYVEANEISWTDAKAGAEARTHFGQQGYLATITSATENQFITDKLQGDGWIGASDAEENTKWKWVTGPESGQLFFTQNADGQDADGNNCGTSQGQAEEGFYANWNAGGSTTMEPNDAGGCTNENYAHIIGPNSPFGASARGKWNDYADNTTGQYSSSGYVVEYGGMPGDPVLQLSGEVTVSIVEEATPISNAEVKKRTVGDVHINTPDGLVYDFQERGDFLLTQSTDGSVVLQARQDRWKTYPERPVSTNIAAALNVAGDKLEFYLEPERSFYINDVLTDLPTSTVLLPQGGQITLTGNGAEDFTIYWPDGKTGARVVLYPVYMDLGIARLSGDLTYEGVLGNMDGNRNNDIQLRDGEVITPPASHDDLKRFGDSWRLSDAESLFNDPLSGEDTAEAAAPLTINDLDPAEKAAAEDTCENAGVTDPLALHNCVYDVAATGDDSFVDSAKGFQEDIEDVPAETFVAAVPDQGLPLEPAGEPAPSVTGCYWQNNVSNAWELQEGKTFEECRALDSCYGGLGESGGGCYKWADSADSDGYAWEAAEEEAVEEEAVEAVEELVPEATAEPADEPAAEPTEEAADDGPLSGICASAMIMPMLLGMIGGWGVWNGRRRRY